MSAASSDEVCTPTLNGAVQSVKKQVNTYSFRSSIRLLKEITHHKQDCWYLKHQLQSALNHNIYSWFPQLRNWHLDEGKKMTMEYVYIFVMYALLPEFSISIQSRLVHCAPDLAAASTAPMVILLSSLHALKQVINIQATFFQCTYIQR